MRPNSETKTCMAARIAACLALVGLLGAPATAEAQEGPLSVEGRVGVTFPTGDLADAGGEAGLSFAGDLLYNFTPRWSAYAGWKSDNFNCDGCAGDFSSSGPHAGVKLVFPREGDALPWLSGGLLLAEAEAVQGGAIVKSSRSPALELGIGIDLALQERLALTPAVRYNFYSADLPVSDLTFSYFVLDLGLHYHF